MRPSPAEDLRESEEALRITRRLLQARTGPRLCLVRGVGVEFLRGRTSSGSCWGWERKEEE